MRLGSLDSFALCIPTVVLALTLVGCGDQGGAGSSSASAASTGAKSDKSAAAAQSAPAKKEPTTKLTQKQMDEAYESINKIERMKEPWDKKKAELVSKLGEPAKTDGDVMFWYGIGDPNRTCYQMKVSEKGGAEIGGTDAAKCGL